VKNNEKCSQ